MDAEKAFDTTYLCSRIILSYFLQISGILYIPNIKDIVSTNYDPLVKEVIKSLDRWNIMPISIIGRMNIVKMSILPKFLYIFWSIPLTLPNSFFFTLKKAFTGFIWNNKHPWLHLSLLYLPYDRGLPNMRLLLGSSAPYCHVYFSTTDIPAWMDIEKTEIMLPLQSNLYSSQTKILKKHTDNPF